MMAKAPTSDDKPTKPAPAKLPSELTHPDPEGKMRSYAPGYGPGPDGEPVEMPDPKPSVAGVGAVTSNPVILPQRSE